MIQISSPLLTPLILHTNPIRKLYWRILIAFAILCNFVLGEESLGLTDVCVNNCTGHGTCSNFMCDCYIGYFGDDCRLSFAPNSRVISSTDTKENATSIIPILGAGHYNLTTKNFTKTVGKTPLMLVGFSSVKCHKCIMYEQEYEKASKELRKLGVPFARANEEKFRNALKDINSIELPALVVYRQGRPYLYQWQHSAELIVKYVKKQLEPAAIPLISADHVLSFVGEYDTHTAIKIDSVSMDSFHAAKDATRVVGFFSDSENMEEDEYVEFLEAIKPLQTRFDVIVGVVTDANVVNEFKGPSRAKLDWIDRSPSMIVQRLGLRKQLLLDEFYGGGGGSLTDWVLRESLPVVDMLTTKNFPIYEKLSYPMLLLFLDCSDCHAPDVNGHVGGESGGVSNNDILDEFHAAASEHVGRVAFLWLDGTKHSDQMRKIGLFGGKERLPAVAFNTKDGRQMTFSERLPINRDTLLQFVADFLSGKLVSKAEADELAKKALTNPRLNKKNLITDRKPKKAAPTHKTGISEQFDLQSDRTHILPLTSENFESIALDESKDVLILFHEQGCEPCANMAVYFKRMAERFHDLGFAVPIKKSRKEKSTNAKLVIARFDMTDEMPPPLLHFHFTTLPALVILPAKDKSAPYRFFSGVAKVLEMMKWVAAECEYELPPLAQLRPSEIDEYKRQVAEREEYRAQQQKIALEAEAKEALRREQRKQKMRHQERERMFQEEL